MQTALSALSLGTLLAVTAPMVHVIAQTTEPIIGTWELNVAKSKFSPGPGPRSETRTYVVAGKDIKASLKGVGPDGKPTVGEWTINDDGRDRPQSGSPDADSVSFKRVDAFTVEFTQKRAGKVVMTGTRAISPDGKIMTISNKGRRQRPKA